MNNLLGILFLAASATIGYFMNQSATSEQIWGYETFFCLFFLWASILSFFGKWISSLANKKQLLIASSSAGLLLAAGFMFSFAVWALFIGFAMLLWVENQIFIQRANFKSSYWMVFKLSYNTFVIWNICSTYWVANAGFIAGCIAVFLNSFFMTLPFLGFHFVKKQHNQKVGLVAFVSCWLSFEFGHLYWDLSWPWLTLGNAFHHSTYLVQWYEYTGVFGGSLWILLVNVFIFQNYNNWQLNKTTFLPTFAELKPILLKPLIYILIPTLFSVILFFLHTPNQGEKKEILALQPNYEPHFIKFNVNYQQVFNNFYQLIIENASQNTAFIVFPETSFDDFNIRQPENETLLKDLDTIVAQFANSQLIIGISATQIYEENQSRPAKVGKVKMKSGDYIYYNSYNSAIWINKTNLKEKLNIYHKSKLVPGSEIMPYIGNIDIFANLIMKLGGTSGYALTTQEQRMSFATPQGNVAPVICYESIYGSFVTEYIKKGAQVLFIITNDGWWGDTDGYKQHLNLAKLRAIETRRWIVRAANSGSSAFINSSGQIIAQTNYNERTILKNEVYLKSEISFYVKYGDLIGRISLLLTLILLVSALGKLASPTRKEVQQLRKDNNL